MDKQVQVAEQALVDITKQARDTYTRSIDEFASPSEIKLQDRARAIRSEVGTAMRLAGDRIDRESQPDWPAPYQALLDEEAPLLERQAIEKALGEAFGQLQQNPWTRFSYSRHYGVNAWDSIMQKELAQGVQASWKAAGGGEGRKRLIEIQNSKENKMREGTKALTARRVWNDAYTSRKTEAEHQAQAEVMTPRKQRILNDDERLERALLGRRNEATRAFGPYIKQALENLQLALIQQYQDSK